MKNIEYEDFLALTSQFYFCPYPLRLDAYNICSFKCEYCFVRNRLGNYGISKLKYASLSKLKYYFNESEKEKPKTIICQMIKEKIPFHFGGMSDPFSNYEIDNKLSYNILKYLTEKNYPVIVSTKSNLLLNNKYKKLWNNANIIWQISYLGIDEIKRIELEGHNPLLKNRIEVIRNMINKDAKIVVRVQPVIPFFYDEIIKSVELLIKIGVKNIVFEHLKLPIDNKSTLSKIFQYNFNIDIYSYYKKIGAKISGREYILPLDQRQIFYQDLRKIEGKYSDITLSISDNDMIHLNKYNCCIGHYQKEKYFKKYFKYNYSSIINKAILEGNSNIDFNKIIDNCPFDGSISHYINSNSRLNGKKHILKYYLEHHLNTNKNISPNSFYGIKENSFKIDYSKIKKIKKIS